MRRALLVLVFFTWATSSAHAFDWSGKVALAAKDLDDENPEKRLHAVEEVAAFDIEDAKPYLLRMLHDQAAEVRVEAAKALAHKHVKEAVKPVAEWLSSPDKAVRVGAADVLGDIGAAEGVGPLSRLVNDTDAEVRRAAVADLGKIGGADVVVPILGALDDDSMQVRKAAAEALAGLGDARAVIPLLERFADSAKDVRLAAIIGVGKLGDERAVPALVRLLRDPMPEAQIDAAEALGDLHAVAAVDELIACLGAGSDQLHDKITYALGQIRDPRGVRELVVLLGKDTLRVAAREALQNVGPAAVEPLLACLARADCPAADAAVAVLASIGDKRATPALVNELQHPGRVKRDSVIAALGAIADPAALVPLLALMNDPDAALRNDVLNAVRPVLDPRAEDVLVHALDDKDADVRAKAAQDLGILKAKAGVPRLLRLTSEETTATVLEEGIWALGEIGDPQAAAPLIGLVRTAKLAVQRAAADALAKLKDPASVPNLVAVALDPSSPARREAVWALGGILRGTGDENVRKTIEPLAHDADLGLALTVVDALAAMRSPASIPVLVELVNGPSRELRRAALEVLGDFGPDPRAEAALRDGLNDEDDAVRGAAAWALGKLGDPAVVKDLALASHRGGFATTTNAAAALARLGGADARDPLLVLAQAKSPSARANAAVGLGAFGAGDGEARKALAALAADGDKFVRANAARALARGGATSQPSSPSSPASQAQLTWIHITGTSVEQGNVRRMPYRFVLPDGVVKGGYTDARGELGEEQVPGGSVDFDWLDAATL